MFKQSVGGEHVNKKKKSVKCTKPRTALVQGQLENNTLTVNFPAVCMSHGSRMLTVQGATQALTLSPLHVGSCTKGLSSSRVSSSALTGPPNINITGLALTGGIFPES